MATLVNMNSGKSREAVTKSHTFTYKAPAAGCVQLVGDFTHWQRAPINLRKGGDTVWRTTVELEPGPHRYRFLVDGEWRDDPSCAQREPNPFGSVDDVCQIS